MRKSSGGLSVYHLSKSLGLGSKLLIVLFACVYAETSLAQKAPPEIRAQEDRDPAAGEVVIINRKTKRASNESSPPDPYAPIKLKPLAPDDKRAARDRAATGAVKSDVPKPDRAERPAPTKNKENNARETTGEERRAVARQPRLQQFPQEVLITPPLPTLNDRPEIVRSERELARNTDADRGAFERNRARTERARRQAAERRRVAERRRSRQYNDYRRRDVRPWRRCRRLAWRCEDGFERACYRWRRVCS